MEELALSTTRAYLAPESLDDLLAVLAQYGEDAKMLAGGQSLLVLLRQGLIMPTHLVSLRRIPELATWSFTASDGMQLGAMVRQVDIERSEAVNRHYTALAEAAGSIATPQVRNRGTIGGNLCHADPTADPPAALIALGARILIAGPDGQRQVPVESFFRDYMEVDLGDAEVLTAVLLPPPTPRSGSAYIKHRLREIDSALVGVGVWLQLDEAGTRVIDVRIGLTGVGATPVRATGAEETLRGAVLTDDRVTDAGAAAAAGCEPFSDTEASAWYRREMVSVLVQRAVRRAVERSTRASGSARQ